MAIIGANGAGKSTLLRADRRAQCRSEAATSGSTGAPIGRLPAHRRVGLGISLVPEGRRIFPSLSVEENLRVGAYRGRPGPWTLEAVYRPLPDPARAGATKRGGALGRRAAGPRDRPGADGEPAAAAARRGVARSRSDRHPPALRRPAGHRRDTGTTVLLVEQNVDQALSVRGRVLLPAGGPDLAVGPPAELTRDQITSAYFGHLTHGLAERDRPGRAARVGSTRCSRPACRSCSASCAWSTSRRAT